MRAVSSKQKTVDMNGWRTAMIGLSLSLCAHAAAHGANEPGSSQAEDERIQLYRMANVTLTVLGADGLPIAHAPVTITMTRQKFLFGCNALSLKGCENAQTEQLYEDRLAGLVNYVTLPFYWDSYEPTEGRVEKPRLRAMAEWCQEHGIRPKGHPLCWHYSLPKWLDPKSTDDLRQIQTNRIRREVSDFAGLVDTWEPVNEIMSMPDAPADNPIGRLCRAAGADNLVRDSFATARLANPKATLILNDFDVSPERAKRIAVYLLNGLSIDAVGIQLHMHKGVRSPKDVWNICETLGKLGKPLQITEITILSGPLKTDDNWFSDHPGWNTTPEGEQLQAKQVVELYRLLFSHPAVQAITWWDPTDYHAWQGAPAGLLRKDMSPKPAYDALVKLIKGEWWTGPLHLTTDDSGRIHFRGFLGSYTIVKQPESATFNLDTYGTTSQDVLLVAPNATRYSILINAIAALLPFGLEGQWKLAGGANPRCDVAEEPALAGAVEFPGGNLIRRPIRGG
jgi:GH35 family endo-1,4-beta-xylanase